MARSARERIDTIWDADLVPDIREYTKTVARQVLAEEQMKGFDEKPRRIVDRQFDAPLDAVRPFGVIEFIARGDIAELLRWIWAGILRRSPVLTGRYKGSHLIMLNGTSIGSDPEAVIAKYKPGDRIQIVNTMPYAKKIEGRSKTKAGGAAVRGQSKKAPNGVYRAVFGAATRRYGKVAFIDFKYVKLDTGVTVMGYQGGAHFTAKKNAGDIRRRKRIKRPAVYPSIHISQSEAGRLGSPT
jgi:hypothetical protein